MTKLSFSKSHGLQTSHHHRNRLDRRLARPRAEETPARRTNRRLRSRSSLEAGPGCGAIDAGTTNPADAVRGSDLVVLATPVIPILDLIARLGPALPPKTLVTDVGSTKAEIVERAAKSFGRQRRAKISRRASHGGQRKRRRGVCRCRSFRRRGLALHAASRPERSRRTLRRIYPLRGKDGRQNRGCSIPPIMIASAPGSAICRR